MFKAILVSALFLALGVLPAAAAWVKNCDPNGTCYVVNRFNVSGEQVLAGVDLRADPSKDEIFLILPLLGAEAMGLRIVVPGAIDYVFANNDCYDGDCSFRTTMGARGVADLKRGSVLTLMVAFDDRPAQPIDVDLTGFTKAYDSDIAIPTEGLNSSEVFGPVQPDITISLE